MEERRFYPCRLRLNGAEVFVVWYSGERDGFVRDDADRLLTARTHEALTSAAGERDISLLNDQRADYDFDRIWAWCGVPDAAEIDCRIFLDAWNFLDDLAGLHTGAETAYTRLSRKASGCYDKLFWGNNLPAVTPPGERFDPVWRAKELTEIRRVMKAGIRLLESELRSAGVDA
jgi:hypothetical protein